MLLYVLSDPRGRCCTSTLCSNNEHESDASQLNVSTCICRRIGFQDLSDVQSIVLKVAVGRKEHDDLMKTTPL